MAELEVKKCSNCSEDFNIESEDFDFYRKIDVPPPTFCPQCRRQRRHAWRNDLTFYNRQCDACKEDIISLYSPNKPLTVYCVKCWWSDNWDPKSYGRNIDFSRPFFEQYNELQRTVPLIAMVNDDGIGSVNCEYTQNTSYAKNCYMVSTTWKLEDCLYCYHVGGPETSEVVDCNEIFVNTHRAYDSIFLESCYDCRSCHNSASLNNCSFCYDCRGCSDCFMSVGLRNKKYYIRNKPHTKEEYEKILASYKLDTWSGVKRAKAEFKEFILKYPRRFASISNSKDCTGDMLFNCKNMKQSFVARGSEDCKFFESGNVLRDCYDLTVGGESNECYEGITPDYDYRAFFSIFSNKNSEVTYVENCHSSKHLFGCSSLRSSQYCILNKQYSKKEYFELRQKLVEHMKETGEWGEFFPANLSHFGYNETIAQIYFPLKKEQAAQRDFKWEEKTQFTKGKETVEISELPDSIRGVKDSILKEVLACELCTRNYKIVPQELKFYRKMSIPLPRKCFFCRNDERINFRGPYSLWHRQCMCDYKVYENSAQHNHHPNGRCENEFETSYKISRPEIIYCKECYEAEVV